MTKLCAVTVDVHAQDDLGWIRQSSEQLASKGVRATYFVPTALLAGSDFLTTMRNVAARGHEIGTHGHQHDRAELVALGAKTPSSLAFMARSYSDYADAFGYPPRAFRSPCWCRVSARALDQLAALGYNVDSSSTPQRLGLLSSSPFENPWLFSGRSPRLVRAALLEVPTTTFLIPFGSMMLAAARLRGSRALALAFAMEALLTRAVVNIQLHPSDFAPERTPLPTRLRFGWRDLIPRAGRGIVARRLALDLNPRRMHQRVWAVLEQWREFGFQFVPLREVYAAHTPDRRDSNWSEPSSCSSGASHV